MKTVVLFLMLSVSLSVFGWSCPKTNNSTDVEVHWNLATEVFWGRIVEGRYIDSDNTHLVVDVYDYLKGSGEKSTQIFTSHEELFRGLEVGSNYIFYMYSSDRLNFCSVYAQLPYHRSTLDRLIDFYGHDYDEMPKALKYALNQANKLP